MLLLVAGMLTVQGETEKEQENVDNFMRGKLLHCQFVLEGLTTEDYDSIARHAQAMNLLSRETAWQVLQTPEYVQRSTEFRRATESLVGAARKKNLDGATLGYVQVTLKCIECHKYVRRVRHARIDSPMAPQLATLDE